MGHTGKKVFTQRKTKQTLETNRISEVGLPARTSNVYSFFINVRKSQEFNFRLITTSKNNFGKIHISRPTP